MLFQNCPLFITRSSKGFEITGVVHVQDCAVSHCSPPAPCIKERELLYHSDSVLDCKSTGPAMKSTSGGVFSPKISSH